MNFQCAYILVSLLIFVKTNTSAGKRSAAKRGIQSTDTRNKHYRYNDVSKFNLYFNLLNQPFLKKHFMKLLKKKNYENHAKTPFVDLTRLDDSLEAGKFKNFDKFSQDYIDVTDLARYVKPPNQNYNPEIILKITPNPYSKETIDYNFLKILNQGKRRMVPYQKRSKLEYNSDESSSDSESDEEKAGNSRINVLHNKNSVRYVPKRFQVINNSEESDDDDDNDASDRKVINFSTETSSSDDSSKRIQVINHPKTESDDNDDTPDQYIYIQSPTRTVNTNNMEWRRRLKHFLPKRVHWDIQDFQNLRNYWIDGPRGRYQQQYKTPY